MMAFMYKQGSPQPQATPLQNQYKVYNSAVNTQAHDYDTLQQGYNQLFNKAMGDMNNPANTLKPAGQYTPSLYNYTPSADYQNAFGLQKGLAETGGLTSADQANLRERGISPIRAVYANANRDIDRQRVLQGGFSPNYTASKAKLSRDLSQSIADQTTNVNAEIAKMVQSGKLQATPQLLQAAQSENALQNQYGSANADRQNQASQFNLELPLKYSSANIQNQGNLFNNALEALRGQTSLYGTTPALSSLFGQQAMQGAQLQGATNQENANRNLQGYSQTTTPMFGMLSSAYGGH